MTKKQKAAKRRKKPLVKWIVNIDMRWSDDYNVMARTEGEANRKAWAKFKRLCSKKNFNFSPEKCT